MSTTHILRPRIHILTNGRVAEPNYFTEFRDYIRRARNIVVRSKEFGGYSLWQLVERAIVYKQNQEGFDPEDQVWCVFDVDQYLAENRPQCEKAVKLAKENEIFLAWSNECFELWFLLHFQDVTSPISRKQYHDLLNTHLQKCGHKYKKNMKGMFNCLLELQSQGIQNAKRIFNDKMEKNPSTSTFQLVEKLNTFLYQPSI